MNIPECEAIISGSLALVFRISRWSGMAPLSLTKLRNSWRVNLSPSFTVYGYLLVISINVILSLTVIWDMMTDRSRSVRVRSDTRLVVWLADVGVMLTSVSVATYTSTARIRSTIVCFNTMHKINKELKISTFKWHGTSERNRNTFFIVWSSAQIMVLIYDYFLIQKFSIENGAVLEISCLYIFYYLCYWLTNLLEMQFIMMAMHIVSGFRAVNEHLSKILQDTKMWSSSKLMTTTALSKNFGKPLYDIVSTLGIEQKRKIIPAESTISNQSLQESIENLSLCYATLCDVLREVDRCHGPVVFILLTSYVLQLIVTPYYLVYNVFSERAMHKAGEVSNIILQVFWIILHSTTLIALVEPGQYTHNEIEKTKELVSRLMRFANTSFDPMSASLEQFYQQIMLNQVAYSPLGFTILNRPLIASVASGITTYLIVLIQFNV